MKPPLGEEPCCYRCFTEKTAAAVLLQKLTRGRFWRAPRSCLICLDDAIPRGAIAQPTLQCPTAAWHASFCRACLGQLVRTAVADGIEEPACPFPTCDRKLTEGDVIRLGGRAAKVALGALRRARFGGRFDELEGGSGADPQTLQWLALNTRACPACSVLIYRASGCNHMRCTRCDRRFDWASAPRLSAS